MENEVTRRRIKTTQIAECADDKVEFHHIPISLER